jgi:GAF domain-containing protein
MQTSAHKVGVLDATAARLSGELDLNRLLRSVVDTGPELSKAEIGAFFYNAESGGTYQLFALSDAPRETFAAIGIPRTTELFRPALSGESVIRGADVATDPRFGKRPPHHRLPPGHWPVRSYLAVPVISSSGKVLGGLLCGHSQLGVFTAESAQSIVGLAAPAAIAIDHARLFMATPEEITTRKRIGEQQRLLLGGLNHRVKNTLATAQSIASQALRSTPNLRAFKQAFEARLRALGEAHNLLLLSEVAGRERAGAHRARAGAVHERGTDANRHRRRKRVAATCICRSVEAGHSRAHHQRCAARYVDDGAGAGLRTSDDLDRWHASATRIGVAGVGWSDGRAADSSRFGTRWMERGCTR